ncbi:hypothetical protein IAU59_003035 [Kwoniella sp. CBS 9459]
MIEEEPLLQHNGSVVEQLASNRSSWQAPDSRRGSLISYLLDNLHSDHLDKSYSRVDDPEREGDGLGNIRHHVDADASAGAESGAVADTATFCLAGNRDIVRQSKGMKGEDVEWNAQYVGLILPLYKTDPTTARPSVKRLSSATPLLFTSSTAQTRTRCEKGRRSRNRYVSRWKIAMTGLGAVMILGLAMSLIWNWTSERSKDWIEVSLRSSKAMLLQFPDQGDNNAKYLLNTSAPRRIMACSHNDELHGRNALRTAVALGYGFIEADVHLGRTISPDSAVSPAGPKDAEGALGLDPSFTLLVGHDMSDLSAGRTLKRVYLDPLYVALEKHNAGGDVETDGWVGLYENDPTAGVVLMIDMKADGVAIWPYLAAALEPFLSRGYLTSYNVSSGTFTRGPLTIVGTGSTPISKVYYSSLRYIFYDAPLRTLSRPYRLPRSSDGPAVEFEWDKTISPIASSKFPLAYYFAAVGASWASEMRRSAAAAKSKGIESRWWGVARNPNWLKRSLWSSIRSSGASVMNVDDLAEYDTWLSGQEAEEDEEHEGFDQGQVAPSIDSVCKKACPDFGTHLRPVSSSK